jgi:amino acid adenylation domain-containing protein
MNIRSELSDAARRFAARDAIWISGSKMTYAALANAGDAIVSAALPARASGVVVVIAERDFPFYSAIFGCLTNGFTYVPVNPKWPAARINQILSLAAPDTVLLDSGAANSPLGREIVARWHGDTWQMNVDANGASETIKLRNTSQSVERQYEIDDFAYIMFTSGSTGIPKGVPIQARSVSHYAESMSKLAELSDRDRVIQAVELTFDLSMHDMSLCWIAGAMLVVVPESNAPLVPRFIRQLDATSCLSVPSAAAQSKNYGLLRTGAMPSLRTAFFCGEALPASLAESWLDAAPNARVYNIYGPTEATIAFSSFECVRGRPAPYDIVPLGHPIGAQKMEVADNEELMLSGPQLSPGYLLDRENTARAFVERSGTRWYRTGDRAYFDETHGFIFKGRMDTQVKIRGYRVELGEIESAMRKHFGTDLVAAVPVRSLGPSTYEAMIGVVCGATRNTDVSGTHLRDLLPTYMVPERIVSVREMPKNANDKVDYLSLKKLVETGM